MGNIGWSFHLPLCKEGLHLFLWDAGVTCTPKVHIPFGCAFLVRGDVDISSNAGSFGNMRLTGTFTDRKLKADDPDYHQYLVNPTEWKTFVATNEWLKGGNVNKHTTVEVLKCNTLQKEVAKFTPGETTLCSTRWLQWELEDIVSVSLVFMARLVYVIHYLDKTIMLIYMLLEILQHSDPNAHIHGSIKIGNEIFVRELEYGKGYHLANVVQFVGGGWLKIRWQWKGWKMANVRMS